MSRPLFQLRKEVVNVLEPELDYPNGSLASVAGSSSLEDSSSHGVTEEQHYANTKVLTENERYAVKRLAPDLSKLDIGISEEIRGSIDPAASKALVNNCDDMYIWDFKSNQKTPPYSKIPLHDEDDMPLDTLPPLCIFTWPAAMDESMQPFNGDTTAEASGGVCIINTTNGHLVYYENIEAINNLYTPLSKAKAHELDLKLKGQEVITQAINCEPAGLLLATSYGRVLFITIRDSNGKPKLEYKKQLIKSQRGFLFGNLAASKEIVSLKKGPMVNKGETIVYIATRGGDLQVWQLMLTTGSIKRLEVNLFDQLLDSLQDLYPFAHGTLQVLDTQPLYEDSSLAHLVLSSIVDGEKCYYILSTILLDEKTNSFTIFSTYRLNSYMGPLGMRKPEIIIPKLLKTNCQVKKMLSVFVLFDKALVLTQISSKIDQFYPLKRKWEDIISFREDIHIVGSGHDSAALYVITKELGVLEVTTNQELLEKTDELRFVKSHIDQAIYFSNISSNPIDFRLAENISLETAEVEEDIRSSSDQIFYSTSKYIPPSLDDPKRHLNLRLNFFRILLDFVKENFNYRISPEVKLELVERFEIMNCCLELYEFLEESEGLRKVWARNIHSYNAELTVKKLVINQLDEFPVLLSRFLVSLSDNSLSSKLVEFKCTLVNMLVGCFYNAIFEEGENTFRYTAFELDPLEVGYKSPWFTNCDIFHSINQIFFEYKFSITTSSEMEKTQLLNMVKILYYIHNQFKSWINQCDDLEESTTEAARKIDNIYNSNHLNWNQVLCELNLQEESMKLAEHYIDLESLVETLETLDYEVSEGYYEYFFQKMGYDFAATLFEHYIRNNNLKDLFHRFPDKHDYLRQFFDRNKSYGNISWIQEILDGDYSKASGTLSDVSLGDAGMGKLLDDRELYLNVAKLSLLAGTEKDIDHEQLSMIQLDINVVNGQKNLYDKVINQRMTADSFFSSSSLNEVFEMLSEEIKEKRSIAFNEVIEMYSMLGDIDSFFHALKLLSLDGDILGYEVRQILMSTVWRRCILQNIKKSDDILLEVLLKCFHEKLFDNETLLLPDYTMITNRTLYTEEYYRNVYSRYVNDTEGIKQSFDKEFEAIEKVGTEYNDTIRLAIASANAITDNKRAINYEQNTIEHLHN